MKMNLKIGVMCSSMIGLLALSSPALTQQKTVKACQEEWRSNKAASQVNGTTEKAYMEQCRGGGAQPTASTAPSVAPSAMPMETTGIPPLSSTRTATAAGRKAAKSCQEEWGANKVAIQANGVTEKAYVEHCRGGAQPITSTAPSLPPSAMPMATTGIPPLSPMRAMTIAGQNAHGAGAPAAFTTPSLAPSPMPMATTGIPPLVPNATTAGARAPTSGNIVNVVPFTAGACLHC
jgi:hypothetical protein